ncbi:MAG TPA: ATP synthase F1 subunit gamma [Candidatus Caccovicinus merdipullorum]|uniref:ATP synthase gamma chain n=1 Tax=Candidatus Caccovicinus merdipullorum TaxID=2840724 RepID=A0A9D1GK65_9FIRM|nr:ATP synthase F1 subunit gamma [Candidatus Caccovicinus merdipullorum]
MASMRDIKRRRDSIESTEQITRAMKLVSTAKLQKARERAEASAAYTKLMYEIICSILGRRENWDCRYGKTETAGRKAVAAVTSNRGLAGGYNNNLIRLILNDERLSAEDTDIYAAGRKGLESLAGKGYTVKADYSKAIDQPSYEEASRMAYEMLDAFSRGEVGEIYLACTFFKNTAVHVPKLIRLLPVDEPAEERDFRQQTAPINYEPDEDQVLDALIPQYISGMIYGGLLEAAASENGARMTAMDSASNNAREMMGMLTLQYNQARQNAITQELTEIVAGANAIG